MIKNPQRVEAIEREFLKTSPYDYRQTLEKPTLPCKEVRRPGVFPPGDPLEGIDTDIRVNTCLKNSQ